MGRNARLKRERREKRRKSLNEAWLFFTSRGFLKQVRQMILDAGANVNSCIACTKILVELGTTVGLDIRPLTVEASVFNPVFTEHIKEHGIDPEEDDMVRLGEAGGRFVVLGARDEREPNGPGMWPGHMVAVMRAKGKPVTVIDLSIDQASRPKKDINIVDPLVFGVPDEFTQGTSVATGIYGTKVGQICFIYRGFPEDTSYEAAPDWQRSYEARTHDKIEAQAPEGAPKPSGLLGPDGLPLGPAGE